MSFEDRLKLLTSLTKFVNSIGNEKLEGIAQRLVYDNLTKKLVWGTFGKEGDEPLHFKRLIDCDTEHLENILVMCNATTLSPLYARVILYLIKKRWLEELRIELSITSGP